jgi:class 3 adenylate cyclase
VLVDGKTAAAADAADGLVESAGRRMLKGFDSPVMVFSYATGATASRALTPHGPDAMRCTVR